MLSHVEIAFDCLPLRVVSRMDAPLDASSSFRARCERLQQAIETHGAENAYYLYNTSCVYRFANSDVENMLRFSFDGTVLTDRGDCRAEKADLSIELAAETCGSLPPAVLAWFKTVVERAVLLEFDHFIAAGKLAQRVTDLADIDSIADIRDFAGMYV